MQQKGDLPTFFCLSGTISAWTARQVRIWPWEPQELHTILFPSDISYDRSPLQGGRKKIHSERIKKELSYIRVCSRLFLCVTLCVSTPRNTGLLFFLCSNAFASLDFCNVKLCSVTDICDNHSNATPSTSSTLQSFLRISVTYINNIALNVKLRHWTEPEAQDVLLAAYSPT